MGERNAGRMACSEAVEVMTLWAEQGHKLNAADVLAKMLSVMNPRPKEM